jgi:hypothetical protein
VADFSKLELTGRLMLVKSMIGTNSYNTKGCVNPFIVLHALTIHFHHNVDFVFSMLFAVSLPAQNTWH